MSKDNTDWSAVYQKAEELVDRNIADETIVVPIRGRLADMQRIYSLSPVAEFIWDRIDGRTDLAAIRDGILKNFEVAPEEAGRDLMELIDALRDAELIRECP